MILMGLQFHFHNPWRMSILFDRILECAITNVIIGANVAWKS